MNVASTRFPNLTVVSYPAKSGEWCKTRKKWSGVNHQGRNFLEVPDPHPPPKHGLRPNDDKKRYQI